MELRSRTKETLKQIAADPQVEARWLNTISLLEFIGSRKIAKTVASGKHPPLFILEHHADETRHAYIFKKLAQETKLISDHDYLAPQESIKYFESLDHGVEAWLQKKLNRKKKDTFLNYLLTTTLIERRAMQLYPLYRSITKNKKIRAELTQIIIEESNHKKPIEEKLSHELKKNGVRSLTPCIHLEEALMKRFINSLYNAAKTSS